MAGKEPAGTYSPESSASSSPLFQHIKFESMSHLGSERCDYGGFEAAAHSSHNLHESAAHSSDNLHESAGKCRKCPNLGRVSCTLQNKNIWKRFTRIGNEMIVTKTGRRLFPILQVNLHGLDSESDYTISLHVKPADNLRYRYVSMEWCITGESEVIQNEAKQIFHHPSSPNSGLFWMKRPISFKSIKVTHYAKSKHGNILLHTRHKYSMEIIIQRSDGLQQTALPIPDTTFIAVSAYQNMELTQLKIDNNPFAKGFRYNARSLVPNARTNMPSSTPASSLRAPNTNEMVPYWQHIHLLHSLAAEQPAPQGSGTSFSADSSTCSSTNWPFVVMVMPIKGTTLHFPVFFPYPLVPPFPIFPISAVGFKVTDDEV